MKFLFEKGHIVKDETKRKISLALTGKHPTEETRLNCSPDNLITLCVSCHRTIHNKSKQQG
jgi:hypothetical protein